ncbi:MAG: rhomboid family intramembrane serine protease [Bacteroidetes bacterium]|nr:rhomboid family intramembrane serine protease [Bacteroidota bacterium]
MQSEQQAGRPIVSRVFRPDTHTSESFAEELEDERRKVIFSAIFSGAVVLVLWIVKLYELMFDLDLRFLGLRPRSLEGLPGILTEPLIHGSFSHLISNSVPLFLLLMASIYFYRGVAFRVLFRIWIMTGVLVWLAARPSLHIGASGVVYGLASFLAVSGFIRNDNRLLAISLLVVFLYGGMIWGIFPVFQNVSWESHLAGAFSGVWCAWIYRRQGPKQHVYFADEETEDTVSEGDTHHTHPNPGIIIYTYIPKDSNESKS